MATSKECYYIGRASGRKSALKPLPKVRGHLIESVGWNKLESTENSTGPILLGTSTGGCGQWAWSIVDCIIIIGYIFESEISFDDSLIKRKTHFTEVYQLMYDLSDHSEPVTGLLLEPFPQRSSSTHATYYVLATTPKRIYEFVGGAVRGESPQFLPMFEHYRNNKGISPVVYGVSLTCMSVGTFLEIPGNLKDSQLQVWPNKSTPKAFAWLTGAGIYYCTLGWGDQQPLESLFVEKILIPYGSDLETSTPVGLSLTEFHCILLYRDRYVI